MSFRNLERLDGQEVSIQIQPDEDGFIGRECPVQACERYFKLTPGTGLSDIKTCRCPYCGHEAGTSEFFTQAQRDYAVSVVKQEVTKALLDDLRQLEFTHPPRGAFGIGISMKVEGRPSPIRWYWEQELETEVVCDECTLRYAVYGVFGFCPDCGLHNSLNQLRKNLDLVLRGLYLAEQQDAELAARLREQALGQLVADFDGFGRAICAAHRAHANNLTPLNHLSFQNLRGARTNIQQAFGIALDAPFDPDAWDATVRTFQKRHLFAHKAGVIDEHYVQNANDLQAEVGRKIRIEDGEIEATTTRLTQIAEHLHQALARLTGENAP